MPGDMRVGMRVDVRVAVRVDVCVDTRVDTRVGMRWLEGMAHRQFFSIVDPAACKKKCRLNSSIVNPRWGLPVPA